MAGLDLGGTLLLAGQLPSPARLDGEVIPGTVNLVLNPDLESAVVGVGGWTGTGDASVTRSTEVFSEGAASAALAFPEEEGSPAVIISTASGLGWTGEPGFILGSVFLRGVFEGLALFLRAIYTDSTTEDGPESVIDAAEPDAWQRPTCSLELDPEKTLSTLQLVLARVSGELGGTVYADAAQVEKDAGFGVTAFASGRYGPPYHYWTGQSHLSPSVRDDIPADVRQLGSDGEYRITWKMYRADAAFNLLEDLSDHVISASVTADRNRQAAWTMTCRMAQSGWARLRPWYDWIVPFLSVTDDKGVTRSGPLGHYVVLPSPVTHHEHMAEYDIDCRSAEYLMGRQAFKGKLIIRKGDHLTKTAEWVITSCALGATQQRPRLQLQHPNKRAKERYEFTHHDSKLSIINELLEAAAMQPVWTSRTGVVRSFRTDTRRYHTQEPVRLWAANFDPANDAKVRRLIGSMPASSRDISGVVRRIPSLGDAENEIVVYTIDPRGPRVKGKYTIDDPTNPVSPLWTGRWRNKTFKSRMVPDGATARAMARAFAEEIGTRIEQVELSVIPDPQVDLLDRIVYLAIYRIDGTPVAVGRFRVLKIEYGFIAENALMKLTLGFVHGVAELQGGTAVRYYDQRNQTWIEDVGQAIELAIT